MTHAYAGSRRERAGSIAGLSEKSAEFCVYNAETPFYVQIRANYLHENMPRTPSTTMSCSPHGAVSVVKYQRLPNRFPN